MIIIQLDSIELSQVIQKAVRKALSEHPDSTIPEADQLLSAQEASEFLNVSVPTIYGYVQKKSIPVNKRGKRLYFSKKELLEWIKKGRRKTADEIAEEAEKHISGKRKGGKR